jgi:hypothetical protein
VAENIYSFGPLQIFKKSEWRNAIPKPGGSVDENSTSHLVLTNCDTMRLTNDGRFKCSAKMSFKHPDSVFFMDPLSVDLEEGETVDIKIWAFPSAVQEFTNTIIATIPLNPVPLEFPISCHGTSPTLNFDGPWTETLQIAESALAGCTEKKALKEAESRIAYLKESSTLDFGRILIGKTDIRVFTIRNTSLLPVAWEVVLGDFSTSPHLTISPLKGVIAVNGSETVTLTFSSTAPLMLAGKFSVRYSDTEGGLSLAQRFVRPGRCTAFPFFTDLIYPWIASVDFLF